MKKSKKELKDVEHLLEERVAEYKKEFKCLTEEQKLLAAYRKIIELRKSENTIIDGENKAESLNESNELLAIVRALDFNCGFLKPLMLYAFCNRAEKYKVLYKESLVSYYKVLENYKLLARELNIDNSFDLSHLFSYLLWNGYYSVNKTHSYKLSERLLLPGLHSFDVIKGKGVCLAYAELLHNYLTVCGKNSSILNCKLPTETNIISCDYRPQIERNTNNNVSSESINKMLELLFKRVINNFGNHAVNLIEENDRLFGYDVTNLFVLNIGEKNRASIINGKGIIELKPLETLILNSNADPNKLYELLVAGNLEQAFTRKEVIFSFENIMEIIANSISLLDDAYDNIHSELEFIDKQTNEIGGAFRKLNKK
ncbi:MAG: hypothetical protein IJO33_03580 [Bacilli bacterium]|nr:hypothetical protein [Bacilli bacterium]